MHVWARCWRIRRTAPGTGGPLRPAHSLGGLCLQSQSSLRVLCSGRLQTSSESRANVLNLLFCVLHRHVGTCMPAMVPQRHPAPRHVARGCPCSPGLCLPFLSSFLTIAVLINVRAPVETVCCVFSFSVYPFLSMPAL